MTALALLHELSARGIRVLVRGDRLSLRGPGHVLTAELAERLRQQKPELLNAARRCPTCSECGAVITKDDLEAWWGLQRVHADCGIRAWARVWQGETLPADKPCTKH